MKYLIKNNQIDNYNINKGIFKYYFIKINLIFMNIFYL